MQLMHEKKFAKPVILTKILDSGDLLAVDSSTTVVIMDTASLNVKSGLNAKISHADYKNRVVDFTSNGNYFTTVSSDAKNSILFNVETKKVVAKVFRHQGNVSCVGIDPKNSYMFSCGDDGKTFALDIKSGKLVFTLPVHVDTINDIAFSENATWVATASYDKKVSLFSLDRMTPVYKMIGHSAPVMKLQFLNNHRLFSIDKESNGIVWDTQTGKVLKRLEGLHDTVVQVTIDSDDRFLFLGTQLGYILVYDSQTYEQLSEKYIKLDSSITSLCFDKEKKYLIIATENSELLFYHIYYGENNLKEFVKNKDYDHIYPYIEKNPLLKSTNIYARVEALWEMTLKKAKLALENSDKRTAIALFKSFKNIPDKNKIMQKVIREYAEFDKFAALAKQGKISLAYSLASQYPVYKESEIYKSLEANWKKSFVIAQKYAIDPKGQDKAREILAPYRGVTEKTNLIQELFSQSEVYKRFRIAMGQKDFKGTFELIKLHPFLKEFPEYEAIMKYADTLYVKAQKFMQDADTHAAIKIFRALQEFPDFEEDAKKIIAEIEAKHKFFNAIKDEDIVLAYNILATSEDLQDSEDGKALQKQWNNDLSKANEYAVEGNISGIKEALAKYMNISSKYMALGTIFGWAYMIQLEQAVKQKKDQAVIENGIKNYILSFGLQDQILSFYEIFIRYYPHSKLTLELQTKGSLSMWRPSMVATSILE